MDLQTLLRIVITVAGFICFIAICFWAYSSRSKDAMDEAANLPFMGDEDTGAGRS
ncbi:cbb3-type cytochrome oxidase subunit 3 [Chitinibacteraceae bacterium HSL-7]